MDLTQYRSKLIGNEDERAVSPVIGVILMVAITVILAAVIAAFVLDLGQGQSANPQAGVTTENVDTDNDGTDDDVRVTINNIQRADKIEYQVGGSGWTEIGSSEVGDSATVGASDGDNIIIRATYEGDSAVLTETTAEF
ncbi:type IV pilin [Natrinema thermotolerans]